MSIFKNASAIPSLFPSRFNRFARLRCVHSSFTVKGFVTTEPILPYDYQDRDAMLLSRRHDYMQRKRGGEISDCHCVIIFIADCFVDDCLEVGVVGTINPFGCWEGA